jgi:hypothetical protein
MTPNHLSGKPSPTTSSPHEIEGSKRWDQSRSRQAKGWAGADEAAVMMAIRHLCHRVDDACVLCRRLGNFGADPGRPFRFEAGHRSEMMPAALAGPGFIEHHRGSCRFGLIARAKSRAALAQDWRSWKDQVFPSRKRALQGFPSLAPLAPLARPHADRGRSHALMTTARGRIRNPTGKRPRPSPAPSSSAVIWRCAPPKAPRQIPTLPFAQTRI